MEKKHLYILAGLIWGIPGVILSVKGINVYQIQPPDNLWWLLLITAAVLVSFFLMFRKIVDRYCARISALPAKVMIWLLFFS